jgi:NAD(P)-dependent dehydrogenase (short-subunit alcohol dehydrogenase family)
VAVIAVIGTGTAIGARIADRIVARGQDVVAVGSAGDGPDALRAAIDADARGRRIAAVLHAEIDAALCREARLAELTLAVWHERCARPIDRALWTARAGFALMATGEGRPGRGGVLGFVCPSVALTGAAGHVALSTASEAIRLLAKSAARRWGRFGVTSNVFAPAVDACLPVEPHADPSDGPEGLQVHATALDPAHVDPADDIASLLVYLAGAGAAGLTGATLGTDGGELMAP